MKQSGPTCLLTNGGVGKNGTRFRQSQQSAVVVLCCNTAHSENIRVGVGCSSQLIRGWCWGCTLDFLLQGPKCWRNIRFPAPAPTAEPAMFPPCLPIYAYGDGCGAGWALEETDSTLSAVPRKRNNMLLILLLGNNTPVLQAVLLLALELWVSHVISYAWVQQWCLCLWYKDPGYK